MKMKLSRRASLFVSLGFLFAVLTVGIGVDTVRSNAVLRAKGIEGAKRLLSTAGPAANSIFSPDKGKFRILVSGQQAGKEEFEIGASGDNWIAHGTTEIQSPQGAMHVIGTLELKPDGTPVRYEWSTTGAKKAGATIVFNGATASVELRLEGARPFTQQFTFASPRIAILDNNLYHQYAVLARLYDWNQKGAQTFSVLVPQEMTPGTITVESLGKQDVAGAKLVELRVKTEDLEIDLFLDGQRMVRLVSPSANAEVLRE
jgi:hypothetical protein